MLKYIIIKPSNNLVTEFYLNIIKKSLNKNKHEIVFFEKDMLIDIEDIFLVTNLRDAITLIIKRPRNKFIYWQQGLEAEESFMRNQSFYRRKILIFFEYVVLKKSIFVFLVSEKMRNYSEEIHNIQLKKKSYIMPCFNVEIIEKNFYLKEKYSENSFAYVGSLAKWQCFEQTLNIYGEIEKQLENSFLYIFTPDIKEAKELVNKRKLINCIVKYVPNHELDKELANIKYGFCIRKDSIVNRVSTPTKLSSYMASGIIPIFTSYIESFSDQTQNLKYKIRLNSTSDTNSIFTFMNTNVDNNEIYSEYLNFFTEHFSENKHIDNISSLSIFK